MTCGTDAYMVFAIFTTRPSPDWNRNPSFERFESTFALINGGLSIVIVVDVPVVRVRLILMSSDVTRNLHLVSSGFVDCMWNIDE